MRKVNGKVKRAVVIFGVMVVFALALIATSVVMVLSEQKSTYTVAVGSTVFDNVHNQATTLANGAITCGWNQKYVLETDSGTKTSLGKETVIYEPTSSSLKVFGSGYRFYEDGTITILNNYTQITELQATAFYRLTNNKFLIVGSRIWDNTGKVNTSNYLYIALDSVGNARLMNDTMNMVCVDENTILYAEGLAFYLGDQTVDLGQSSIDLTAISGSTATKGSSSGAVYDITIRGGNGGAGGVGGKGGIGGIGGAGGQGGQGGAGGQGGIGGAGTLGSLTNAGRTYMILDSAASDAQAMTINYQISDPYSTYGIPYLLVYETYTKESVDALKKSYTTPISINDAAVRITQYTAGINQNGTPRTEPLKPDTLYTVWIGYYAGTDTEPYVYRDVMRVSTATVNTSLRFTHLSTNEVTAYVSVDEGLSVGSMWLGLVSEGTTVVDRIDISDRLSDLRNGGASFDFSVALDHAGIGETLSLELRYDAAAGKSYDECILLNAARTGNPYYAITVAPVQVQVVTPPAPTPTGPADPEPVTPDQAGTTTDTTPTVPDQTQTGGTTGTAGGSVPDTEMSTPPEETKNDGAQKAPEAAPTA